MLLALTQAGLERDASYRLVQRNAMKVWESDGQLSLLELLKAERQHDMAALLTPADRMDGGFRLYSDEDVVRIRLIKQLQGLLGFSLADVSLSDRSGIRAIIDSAMVSYERLPMLEIVFDRLVRLMTTSLRNFTSDNVEVSLDNITSIRFGDYLNSIPLPAILAVFRAEQLDNYGLFTVDSNLIYSIVDVLLGGRRGTAATTPAPSSSPTWACPHGTPASSRASSAKPASTSSRTTKSAPTRFMRRSRIGYARS